MFGIRDKAVFFIKDKNAFVVFYISVYREETGGTIGSIAMPIEALIIKEPIPLYFSEKQQSTASFAIFIAGIVLNG